MLWLCDAGAYALVANDSAPDAKAYAQIAKACAFIAGACALVAKGCAPDAGAYAHDANGYAPDAGDLALVAGACAPEGKAFEPESGRFERKYRPNCLLDFSCFKLDGSDQFILRACGTEDGFDVFLYLLRYMTKACLWCIQGLIACNDG